MHVNGLDGNNESFHFTRFKVLVESDLGGGGISVYVCGTEYLGGGLRLRWKQY